ncbi:MAG: FmdB family zinc ribbon protein [Candidatus Angelobacter sp.]
MPLYEYLCTKCKHRFEKIQKFSDHMIKKCPECGGKVENVLHAPAVKFKGAGWYVNDYGKKSKEGADGSSASSKDSAAKPTASAAKDTSDNKSKKAESKKSSD